MSIEVVAIAAERLTKAVTVVEHRRYAVKTEAIEVEFFQPILAVGHEEMQNLVLAVVKAQAVPCRMLMSIAWIEVLVGITGQVAESLHFVLHSMRMHYVHYHGNALAVSSVYKFLQILRRTETA